MPNKSKLDYFEPLYLKEANKKLDRHVLSAHVHKKTNDGYKKSVFKESLWHKFMRLLKK